MKILCDSLYRLLLFRDQSILVFNDDEMEVQRKLHDGLPSCFNKAREEEGLRPLKTYRDLQGQNVRVYGRTWTDHEEDHWTVYLPDVSIYVFRLILPQKSLRPLCECPIYQHFCGALKEEKEAMGYRWNRWTKMWMEPRD